MIPQTQDDDAVGLKVPGSGPMEVVTTAGETEGSTRAMVGRASRLSGLAAALPPAGTPRVRSRAQAVRASAVGATLAPGLSTVYLLATWGHPHRPVMLAVAVAMLAVAGLVHRYAAAIGRSSARQALQVCWVVAAIVACSALTLLDGGVRSPLGAILPISLIYLATVTPPRVFAVFAGMAGLAYAAVAVLGQPAPPGYPFVYALGTASIATSCLRQATVLASLRRRLAEMVRTDPLTRCLNRRGFDERVEQALAEASRTGEPVTLLLADLDRFKEVNDVHGHQAGDELLAWTGRTLRETLRTPEAVGRIGGDEFGVVLARTGTAEARTIVERLHASLGTTVPASLGYATYPTEAADVDGLKHIADQRVYEAKINRDRRPPSADALSHARSHTESGGPAKVLKRERRRRSIANIGWNMMSNCVVGLLYGVFLADDSPGRRWVVMLCTLGAVSGLAVVWATDRVSRSTSARRLMIISATWMYALAVGTVVADGGVASAVGLGMLAPMPLVALGAPLRLAAGMVGVAAALFVAVGVVVGGASGAYIAMHLTGMLIVSAGCAVQGRAAAEQRTLLRRLAVTDVLTGCLNRRGFDEQFTAALTRGPRAGRVVALLVFDLDGFKQLNDTEGHAAGDELLRWVAATLTANLHPGDLIGRLGGDEFVVLLTSGTSAEAAACAERLRTALGERTPVSVGVAVPDQDGNTFDALYAHADAALYADKSLRRNAPQQTSSSVLP